MDEDETRFKVNDPEVQQQVRMRRLQRVVAKMYMGYLAVDKDFLVEIVGQPEVVAPELVALASSCHRDVGYLQDLLRMRRPLYVTLFKRRAIPPGRKSASKRERELRANSIVIAADSLLRRLHVARVNKDYFTFFGLVSGLFGACTFDRARYARDGSFIARSTTIAHRALAGTECVEICANNYRDVLSLLGMSGYSGGNQARSESRFAARTSRSLIAAALNCNASGRETVPISRSFSLPRVDVNLTKLLRCYATTQIGGTALLAPPRIILHR